jgi:hypothetical protein
MMLVLKAIILGENSLGEEDGSTGAGTDEPLDPLPDAPEPDPVSAGGLPPESALSEAAIGAPSSPSLLAGEAGEPHAASSISTRPIAHPITNPFLIVLFWTPLFIEGLLLAILTDTSNRWA